MGFLPGLGKNTRDRQYGERAIANRDQLYEICTAYERLLEAWSGAREMTLENFRYAEGDTWTKEKEAQLKAAGLPALKINLIWPRLLRISGQETQVRKKMQAVAANSKDSAAGNRAQNANNIFDWVEFKSKMQDQFSLAFLHALIGELGGAIEVYYDTTEDILGIPMVRALNPFNVLFDPSVAPYDIYRQKIVIKTYMASFDEIVEMFPHKQKELEQVLNRRKDWRFWDQVTTWWQRSSGTDAIMYDDLVQEREGLYRIIEMQRREIATKYVATNILNGKVSEISRAVAMSEEIRGYQHIRVVERVSNTIKTMTSAADLVLLQDADNEVQNGMMSIFPVSGFTVFEKSMPIVTQLKGPQEELNKARSSILHILNSVAAAGWQVPRGSLDPDELQKLQQFGAHPRYTQIYNPEAGKPAKIQPNIPPNGHLWSADRNIADINEISAIDRGELGLDRSSSESGVLHRQKVQQAMLTLEPFFRNVDLTKEYVGKYILDLMRAKMENMESNSREITVPRKPAGGYDIELETATISKDDLEDEFAVVVKTGYDTQMQRFQILMELTELERTMPPELVPFWVKIQYTSLPEEDKKEYIEFVKSRQGPSPEQQQQMAQAFAQEQDQAPPSDLFAPGEQPVEAPAQVEQQLQPQTP